MSEQTITGRLVAFLRKQGCQVQRIESRLMKGIPDINYCTPSGVEGWIEMKNCKKLPSRLELTPEQFLWLRTRAVLNNKVFVVFYTENDKLWHIIQATEFKKFTCNPTLIDLDYMSCLNLENLNKFLIN